MENNSLTQYLDLIEAHTQALDKGTSELIAGLRPGAVSALKAFGRLPHRGDEGYPNTSPEEMFAPDFGLNIGRRELPVDVVASFRCDVPHVSTLTGVVNGDSFHPTSTLLKNMPEGLTVMSLAEASRLKPELVGKYLNRLAANSTPTAALNTALLQDGVFIHAAAGLRLDKAVQIVSIFGAPMPTMAVRRLLIVAEEGSSLRVLLCDHSQRPDVKYLSSQVAEVFVGKGASVELYDVEEATPETSRMSETFINEHGAEASFSSVSCSLSGGQSLNSLKLNLAAPHSSAELSALVLATDSRSVDNSVLLTHAAPHCRSRQLFKYALFDHATGAFGGKVVVCPGAVRTDAAQTNRNLLTGTDTHMHSDPQLEIYCDDVKASHGATTGQIDARALFYMRSRGIPEEEARRMLVQAFMTDVVEAISLDALRDRMRALVEKRLGGDATASCADCNACK